MYPMLAWFVNSSATLICLRPREASVTAPGLHGLTPVVAGLQRAGDGLIAGIDDGDLRLPGIGRGDVGE